MKTPTAARPLSLSTTHNTHSGIVTVQVEGSGGKGVAGKVEVYWCGHREGLEARFELTILGYQHTGSTDRHPENSGEYTGKMYLARCERKQGHSSSPASDAAKRQIKEVLDRVLEHVEYHYGRDMRHNHRAKTLADKRRRLETKIEEARQELAALEAELASL